MSSMFICSLFIHASEQGSNTSMLNNIKASLFSCRRRPLVRFLSHCHRLPFVVRWLCLNVAAALNCIAVVCVSQLRRRPSTMKTYLMSSFDALAINPVLQVSTDTTKDSSSTMLHVPAAPPNNESGPGKDDLLETALLKAVDACCNAVVEGHISFPASGRRG